MTYTLVQKPLTGLEGRNGAIATLHKANRGNCGCTPDCWSATAKQVIAALPAPTDSARHAIVIDMLPRSDDRVLLCELIEIRGHPYYQHGWTPLALFLRSVLDQGVASAKAAEIAKKQFTVTTEPPRLGEFLYMQHKRRGGGSFCWGQMGRVNAALLYVDGFKCLGCWLASKLGVTCR